jgi:L-lactate dehydrogenase complex protein LldG
MPPIASEALLPKFEEELRKVAGSTYHASTASELEDVLRGILASSHAKVVMLSRNPLLRKLRLAETIRAWGNTVSLWPEAGGAGEGESAQLRKLAATSFSADVGITGVDFALAETGTLVLSSLIEGAQLASLAPPVHVALYRRGQLIASLEEVLEKVSVSREPNLPSPGRSVVFITGTSRTADIEQILVRGVHGPREVHAILAEDSCL